MYLKKIAMIILFSQMLVNAQEIIKYNSDNSPLVSANIRHIAIDSLNNVWVSDGEFLHKFNGSWSNDQAVFGSFVISDIEVSPNNTIWVSTASGLINHAVHKIFFNSVGVWDSVLFNAFGLYDPKKIFIKKDSTIYFTLINNWPNQIGEDEIGLYFNNNFSVNRPQSLYGINSVVALTDDSLLATDWQGVNLFDGSNWTQINPAGWIPKAIEKRGNGIYAIGERLSKFENSTYLSFPLLDSILSEDSLMVSTLTVERGEVLWIGTDKGKLIKFSENTVDTFNITNESIIDIAVDRDGNKWFLTGSECYEFNEDHIVEVKENLPVPSGFSLSQNYPNPFNPTTIIKYSLPVRQAGLPAVETSHALSVQLKVYNILGHEVATLVNEEQAPGNYKVEFSTTKGISQLASGIYFYKLAIGSFSAVKKMILLR